MIKKTIVIIFILILAALAYHFNWLGFQNAAKETQAIGQQFNQTLHDLKTLKDKETQESSQ